jgi:hypothetical protein
LSPKPTTKSVHLVLERAAEPPLFGRVRAKVACTCGEIFVSADAKAAEDGYNAHVRALVMGSPYPLPNPLDEPIDVWPSCSVCGRDCVPIADHEQPVCISCDAAMSNIDERAAAMRR